MLVTGLPIKTESYRHEKKKKSTINSHFFLLELQVSRNNHKAAVNEHDISLAAPQFGEDQSSGKAGVVILYIHGSKTVTMLQHRVVPQQRRTRHVVLELIYNQAKKGTGLMLHHIRFLCSQLSILKKIKI